MPTRPLLPALALAVAAAFVPAATAGTGYTRACAGYADVMCQEFSCRALDCFWYDCLVWADPPVLDGDTICIDP